MGAGNCLGICGKHLGPFSGEWQTDVITGERNVIFSTAQQKRFYLLLGAKKPIEFLSYIASPGDLTRSSGAYFYF
jgi:hypothetical protein